MNVFQFSSCGIPFPFFELTLVQREIHSHWLPLAYMTRNILGMRNNSL